MKVKLLSIGLVIGLLLLVAPLAFAQGSGEDAAAALAEKYDGQTVAAFPSYEAVSQCWDKSGVTYQQSDFVNDEAFSLLEPEWLMVDPSTELIVGIQYLVKSTDGAPAEWVDEFRGLWPNQQATFGTGWVRLPVWALTDFQNVDGLTIDDNATVTCGAPAEAVVVSEAESVAAGPPEAEVIAGLAAKFDGANIADFPGYEVMGGCFEGSGQTFENIVLADDETFDPLEPEWLQVDPFDGTIVGVSYFVKSMAGAPAEWMSEFRPLWPSLQAFKGEGWVRLPVWALTNFPSADGLTADSNPAIECRLPEAEVVVAEEPAVVAEPVQAEPEPAVIAAEESVVDQDSGLSTGAVIAVVAGVVAVIGGGAWAWRRRSA